MNRDNLIILPFIIFIISLVIISIMAIDSQNVMNNIKVEIFSSINETTTNTEIILKIHNSCNDIPSYYSQTACEYELLNKFMISARD